MPNLDDLNSPTGELTDAMQRFAELYPRMAQTKWRRMSEDRMASLVDAILPEDPIGNARRDLEVGNAKLRADFIATEDLLTAAQLSDMAGHGAKNKSVTASRWKAAGRIFSVPFRRSELYPAFQFREGAPHPALAPILAALPDGMTDWQKAFWFTSPNGWLGGRRPADSLGDCDAAVAAAMQESQPLG